MVVVAVDEAEAEVHDTEVGDTTTMVMEETDGESMFNIPFACVDSIDCCCSGVYHW